MTKPAISRQPDKRNFPFGFTSANVELLRATKAGRLHPQPLAFAVALRATTRRTIITR